MLWLLAVVSQTAREPGSYLAITIGTNPLLVIRGRDGGIRDFHNTCRHRGSQLCQDGRGFAPRIVCPYHKWTYDLDSQLKGTARMGQLFSAGAIRPTLDSRQSARRLCLCLAERARTRFPTLRAGRRTNTQALPLRH